MKVWSASDEMRSSLKERFRDNKKSLLHDYY